MRRPGPTGGYHAKRKKEKKSWKPFLFNVKTDLSTANSCQSHNLSVSSHSSYFSLYNTNLAAWIYICEPVFQLSCWGFGIYVCWQIFAMRFEVFTSVEDYCIVLVRRYISGWSIGVSLNGILRLQFIFGFFFVEVQVCCENWWRVHILCVVCVSCVLYSKFSSDWLAACFIVGFFLKVIHPHCIYNKLSLNTTFIS